ncbi:hypothetical protein G7Y89_g14338 [Cudoniella acicularis]|uniref:Tyrosinase copper-binding domain-containing protein n=1 Tax=Cudoniella acicularis TaxID=354080 RepID=A0A8H4R4D3_9HELO|nr:hypothetical protein G7Y89_g14338 [Cudoniella acicularis]
MLSLYQIICLTVPLLSLFAGGVDADALGDLQAKGRPAINAQLAKSTTCTAAKLQVRKEWGDITVAERKAYIKAVLCLINAPSKMPAGKFPGAKSRYDDFVLTHIQQTLQIHGTGSFLSWHRYYTWAYEQVLHTECGYNGTQPYWDYGRWPDPEKSPIFDGSDSSMGGNGRKVAHKATSVGPAQNGGGCVDKGPFANMTVHLGPVSPIADPAPPKNPASNGLGDNPRCLRRDIGPNLIKYASTANLVTLITGQKDVAGFQNTLQNGGAIGGSQGIHGSAHFTIGADPGGDFYTSPGDPAFFLLHAGIDRLWTIWQSQDLANRTQVIAGGTSMTGGFGIGGGASGGATLQKLTDNIDISNISCQGVSD